MKDQTKEKKTKLKNKEALEFMVVNRGADDPNYQKGDTNEKVLMLIPKDEIPESLKTKHEEILKQIPEFKRGIITEKKEMDKFNIQPESKEEAELLKISNPEDIMKLDDKKIELIFKNIEMPKDVKTYNYNEYGILQENMNPDISPYIARTEFREGIDEYIPAHNMPLNNYDMDIKPEDMDEEHRELFNAIEEKEQGYEELEDDFIIMANDGKVPIDIMNKEIVLKNNENNEIPIPQTKKKMLYITEEEREMLDKKFQKTFESEYKKNDDKGLKKIDDRILDEAINELVGHENDDDEDYEEYEEYEDLEEDEINRKIGEEKDDDDPESGEKPNIKIEYIDKDKPKEQKPVKKGKKKEKRNTHQNQELDDIMVDPQYIENTLKLIENDQNEDTEAKKKELENYYIHKPKVYETIDTVNKSQLIDKNLPKIIEFKKEEKTKERIHVKKNENQNADVDLKVNDPLVIDTKVIKENETKEEKLQRKKLVKAEKKENRERKKKLKQAYIDEKVKQMKSIASMNQTFAYGVSVKEV